MIKKFGFATHGEVIKLLYDAFGLLPRKVAGIDEFDEKDKKTLQKQLLRLASEEGNLVENYEKAITAFQKLLIKYLPAPKHALALAMVFEDLNLVYAEMIRKESTHLSRLESIRYFISLKAIPAMVLAMNRSMMLWQPREGTGLQSEDLFWYLPTREPDGRLIMPLEKVIRWTYQIAGVSQKQFHCPGKLGDPTEPALQQNLENAINWVRGKTIPSLLALVRTFETSFTLQRQQGYPLDAETQKSILTALVYARVATFIAREVEEIFGSAYLDDVCCQIRELTGLLQEEVHEFCVEVIPIMDAQLNAEDSQRVWEYSCAHHDSFVRDKIFHVERTLLELQDSRPGIPCPPDVLSALVGKYGKFAVYLNIDNADRRIDFCMSSVFKQLLDIGFQIKKKSDMTLEQISDFDSLVVKEGQQDALCWFLPWLRGIYHYRKQDYLTAYQHYEAAFELGKYKAGSLQYELVNQFVEIAAKTDKTVSFKKGIEWASYIGLPIRWLRDNEPTDENLALVRYIMKKARYSH